MATPADDDEMRTIGLPRGAAREMLKRLDASKPKAAERPNLEPRGIEISGAPLRASARVPAKVLGTDGPDLAPGFDADRDIPATVPPLDRGRAEREVRSPATSQPSVDQPPRSALGPPVVGARPGKQKASARPTDQPPRPRREPVQSPNAGRPLDEHDCGTAPLPNAKARSDVRSHHDASADLKRNLGEPLDETFSVPARSFDTRSVIQFFNSAIGRWSDLGVVGPTPSVVGRDSFRPWAADAEALAVEHLKIRFDGVEVFVEPLDTLNGVYRKLQPNHPEELPPQNRFRIGRHVLQLRVADPPTEIAPRKSDSGEIFQSRVLAPLGFVELIGPDGQPYLTFPVTKPEERATRIGRQGDECDIALAGDEWVSLRHARVWFSNGKGWLEDLDSTNGTFVMIKASTPIRRWSDRDSGTGDEILVAGYKVRVIEEKA